MATNRAIELKSTIRAGLISTLPILHPALLAERPLGASFR
jgi:hypothetical protein